MSWTPENQTRLNHLRGKDLAGGLSGSEQGELAALMARVEADEAEALAPALDHLRTEVGTLAQALATVQGENQELARLLAQQQTLAADARRFLADFDQRSAAIADALARFTNDPLPAT